MGWQRWRRGGLRSPFSDTMQHWNRKISVSLGCVSIWRRGSALHRPPPTTSTRSKSTRKRKEDGNRAPAAGCHVVIHIHLYANIGTEVEGGQKRQKWHSQTLTLHAVAAARCGQRFTSACQYHSEYSNSSAQFIHRKEDTRFYHNIHSRH